MLSCALVLVGACAKVEKHSSFKTPEAAVDAFVAAVQKDDVPALKKLLGPGVEELLSSGDPVQDNTDREDFLDAYQQKHSLTDEGDGTMTLVVGENDWPFPIPVVKKDGKWRLRRRGRRRRDHLPTRRPERARRDRGQLGLRRRAERIRIGRSRRRSGRDLRAQAHQRRGHAQRPLLADRRGRAAEPGRPVRRRRRPRRAIAGARGAPPYHGYYYRLLYAQGPNANGGEKEYFANGVMTQGFALVAWPADYGASGVQTFIVNQDGVVFQKDLGEDTATAVESIDVRP